MVVSCLKMTDNINFTGNSANKNTKVFIDLLNDIKTCFGLPLNKAVITTDGYFDAKTKMPDLLNCDGNKCRCKGTVMGTTALGTTTGSFYVKSKFDAEEIYSGVFTFPIQLSKQGNYLVSLEIEDYSEDGNVSIWEKSITVGATQIDIPRQITFDLTQVPDAIYGSTGFGWNVTKTGVKVLISITSSVPMVFDWQVGYNENTGFFKGLDELIASEEIIGSCVQTAEPTFELGVTDITCLDDMAYTTDGGKTLALTFTSHTSNGLFLNPYVNKADRLVTTIPEHFEQEIVSTTIGTEEYGTIQISDLSYSNCDGFYLQVVGCDDVSSIIRPLAIGSVQNISDEEFIILENTDGELLFNKRLIGQTVTGYYPKEVELKAAYDYNGVNLDTPRLANVKVVYEKANGENVLFKMDKTFITSIAGLDLPDAENAKDVSITFTSKEPKGKFAEMNIYY